MLCLCHSVLSIVAEWSSIIIWHPKQLYREIHQLILRLGPLITASHIYIKRAVTRSAFLFNWYLQTSDTGSILYILIFLFGAFNHMVYCILQGRMWFTSVFTHLWQLWQDGFAIGWLETHSCHLTYLHCFCLLHSSGPTALRYWICVLNHAMKCSTYLY